ncbi:PH domain-containing protein, partial [Staphylococcus capitis]|uniref:PH domain-containing protein n=1 Tax=Staphylococcus capitis TaxID=29388 RepID=UPI003D0375E2
MGFPDSVLTPDERVEIHLHPHWKALVRPVLCLAVIAAAVVAADIWIAGNGLAHTIGVAGVSGLGLVLFGWLTVWPWLKWRTTHYVFTNERVIMREGVFSREGRDIPLNRINDVSF